MGKTYSTVAFLSGNLRSMLYNSKISVTALASIIQPVSKTQLFALYYVLQYMCGVDGLIWTKGNSRKRAA